MTFVSDGPAAAVTVAVSRSPRGVHAPATAVIAWMLPSAAVHRRASHRSARAGTRRPAAGICLQRPRGPYSGPRHAVEPEPRPDLRVTPSQPGLQGPVHGPGAASTHRHCYASRHPKSKGLRRWPGGLYPPLLARHSSTCPALVRGDLHRQTGQYPSKTWGTGPDEWRLPDWCGGRERGSPGTALSGLTWSTVVRKERVASGRMAPGGATIRGASERTNTDNTGSPHWTGCIRKRQRVPRAWP